VNQNLSIIKKTILKTLAFSLLNTGIMLALSLYWLSLPRTFGDEAFFIKWTSLVKKTLLGIDQKPDPETVLYVDISGSKTLIEKYDPSYEEITGFQKTVITDREQLASFLDSVRTYGKDIPIVIMDLRFQYPSPNDSLLQAAIDSFPFPIVGAQKLLNNRKLAPSVIQMSTGVATYLSSDNQFMKYPLYLQDTLPSLPLVAMNLAHGIPYTKRWLGPSINNHLSLSNPIIDFKVRPFDINKSTQPDADSYHIRSLGTLLYEWQFWEKEDKKTLLTNKTIIIGDYKTDVHDTVFGPLPGSIIVHNAYLTLLHGDTFIRKWWIFLLFGLFFWMSWRIYDQERRREHSKWWHSSRTAVGKIIADSIDDTFFLAGGTILSYFIFNIHINILILLIYLKIVTFILKRFIFKSIPAEKRQ
jgi:hypothetical protein